MIRLKSLIVNGDFQTWRLFGESEVMMENLLLTHLPLDKMPAIFTADIFN